VSEVYVVFNSIGDSNEFVGVFSSREKAELFCESSRSRVWLSIEPVEVDGEIRKTPQVISVGDGRFGFVPESQPKQCACHERDSSYVCEYCYAKGFRGHMQKGL